MRGIKHWAMAFIALVAMLVGFAANQPVPTAAASEDLAAIQKRGYLVVGLSADYAPLVKTDRQRHGRETADQGNELHRLNWCLENRQN